MLIYVYEAPSDTDPTITTTKYNPNGLKDPWRATIAPVGSGHIFVEYYWFASIRIYCCPGSACKWRESETYGIF